LIDIVCYDGHADVVAEAPAHAETKTWVDIKCGRDGRGTYNGIFRLYFVWFALEPFWAELFTVYEHAI
jgi:hypothetical protein